MPPNKPFFQRVGQEFHVSQATLNTDASDGDLAKVWIKKDDSELLIACLNRYTPNVRLDLGFSVDEEITFYTDGTKKTVYLSGYFIPAEDNETEGLKYSEIHPTNSTDGSKQQTNENPWALDYFGDGEIEESRSFVTQMFTNTTTGVNDGFNLTMIPTEPFAFSPSTPQKGNRSNTVPPFLQAVGDHTGAFEQRLQTSTFTGKPQINMTLKSRVLNICLFLFLKVDGGHSRTKEVEEVQTRLKTARNKHSELKIEPPMKKTNVESKNSPVPLTEGVTMEDIIIGRRMGAKKGKILSFGFTIFDSTGKKHIYSGELENVRLGDKTVLAGLNIGLIGMKVGGKRLINCPSETAFGSKGYANKVPPNTDLRFEIDLKTMK